MVAEEYCWAMTQTAGWPYLSRSGSRMIGFRFNLEICACLHVCVFYDCICTHFRLEQTSTCAVVSQRPKPSVLWANPGTSDIASLGGNRVLELGVRGLIR